jgi:two-component system, chemotaxis family, sensor kinase CheA
MSDSNGQPQTKVSLRSHIDKLATSPVVGVDTSRFHEQLRELSRLAGAAGYLETSSFAAQLAETLQSATPESAADPEHLLQQGLALLRDVLSSEPGQAIPAESSVAKPAVPEKSNVVEPLIPTALAQDPELVADFVMESREHLSSIEGQMLALEQNPGATDAIHSVFRGFHTIKGLAGFLEFAIIQQVSHEVETLLDLARNEKLSITTSVVDVVLESADYLKQAIDSIESEIAGNGPKQLADTSNLIARIQKAARDDSAESPATKLPFAAEQVSAPVLEPAESTALKDQRTATKSSKTSDFSIRVETYKLDSLMDLVGEMVIAQSLVRHNPSLTSIQNPRLIADLAQLARITAEVQRTTMGMRMIPIGQLFQRTARMVRDLARKTGKKVELETSGEETEVDKNIAEELSDPLLHMVRNSLDHGIELPNERRAAGKNSSARIRLAAYHQAGQIIIKISDDGRGLNKSKILAKARQCGLIQDGTPLSDTEIYHLIFEPGFSTADQITDISGRGVGMDVVRKNVQKLRGRIDIDSQPGKGATFFLNLPLTLAIIDGLVVAVGDHRYILPIFEVRELIRPTPDKISSVQGRDEMALVRDRLLPIVRLYQRFGVKPHSENLCDGLLVVAESEGKQFCLLVDHLLGKQEVVFKSLGEILKTVKGIAGCAILGDGRVGLILDLNGVFRGTR